MTQTKQEDFIPFKVNDLITVIRKGSKIVYGWNEGDWCVFQILNNRITNVDLICDLGNICPISNYYCVHCGLTRLIHIFKNTLARQ